MSKNMWRTNGRMNFPIDSLVLFAPFGHPELSGASFSSKDLNAFTCSVTGAVHVPPVSRDMDGDDFEAIGGVADFSFVQNTGIFTACGWMKMTDHTADRGQALCGTTQHSDEKGFQFLYDDRVAAGQDKEFRVDIMKGELGVPVITSIGAANIITDNNFHFWVCTGDGSNAFFRVDRGNKAQGTSSMAAKSSGDSTNVMRAGATNGATPAHFLIGSQGTGWIFNADLSDNILDHIYDTTQRRYI